MKDEKNTRVHNAADGERRAMIGFVPQYKIAAKLIYDALLKGTFEWSGIMDPEAEKLDDIQIATQGRLDAYQVKWGEFTGAKTFNDIIKSQKSKNKGIKPPLILQLAEGWKAMTRIHTDKVVNVHLISNDIPSTNDTIISDDEPPRYKHFQGFLRDCWDNKDWIKDGFNGIPTGWKAAINTIKDITGFDEKEFLLFAKDCYFDFNYQISELEDEGSVGLQRRKDENEIFKFLMNAAGGQKRIVKITCQDLLKSLGWENRFKFRFPHEFWVDEKTYQPILSTINDIEQSLTSFSNGYLALIGTPGSGKSTTLTQTFRYRKGYRVIRYYAYIKDDSRLGRGESLNFLHDLVLALKNHGIRGNGKAFPESREELLEVVGSQLSELRSVWQEDGIRTIIIVDGLDHIEREQSPERTLLMDLPNPEAIPEGTLFILGTQKIELAGLSQNIQIQLQQEGRKLTMKPLGRTDVFNVIDSIQFSFELTNIQRDTIFKLSDGHPLALHYLLQKLKTSKMLDEIDTILKSSNPYTGHIDQAYEVYWKGISSDKETRELLALISRLRGTIDLFEVEKWFGITIVERFITQTKHFFRVDNLTCWHFFHNSFRQFILQKTGRDLLGRDQNSHFHKQLAHFASNDDADVEWSWERLYHYSSAGEDKKTIEIGQQDYFREQYFSLRPFEDIFDDITLCLKAAAKEKNGLCVIRQFLIEKELREREENINDVDFPRLLLELNGVDAAIKHIIRGKELRTSQAKALEFCNLLIAKGAYESARNIFNIAEPVELLNGSQGVDTIKDGNIKAVKNWAAIAHYFRPLTQVFKAIEQLRGDNRRHNYYEDPEEEKHYIQNTILRVLSKSILVSKDKKKMFELTDYLYSKGYDDILLELDFDICIENKDQNEVEDALVRIISWAENGNIDDEDKLLIAEFFIKHRNDTKSAYKWVEDIEQPALCESEEIGWDNKTLSPFSQRIRLNRLLAALGIYVDPIKTIPNSSDERQIGIVLFERMLIRLSRLWGKAWAGEILTPGEVVREVRPAIMIFYRSYEETRDWHSWYQIRQLAVDYFRFLIRSVAAHGYECVVAVADEFNKQWQDKETCKYWTTEWQRQISLNIYRHDHSTDRLMNQLCFVESQMGVLDDIYSRVNGMMEQAFAWIEAGECDRAKSLIPMIINASFGIYHDKDNQFNKWVEWLDKVNGSHKENSEERIKRFAGALVVLEQAGRGSNVQDGAAKLIEIVAKRHCGYAFYLRSWLMEHHSIHYVSALEGIILAALKETEPPIKVLFSLVNHLLIPIQNSASEEIAELLVLKCCQCFSEEESLSIIQTLIQTIETKAFPTERVIWWDGILKGLKAAGVDTECVESKINKKSYLEQIESKPKITLLSGEKLTEADAVKRANNYGTLLTLLDSIKDSENISWEKILLRVIDNLTYEQLKVLHSRLNKYDRNTGSIMRLAKRMACLGHKKEAVKIIEEEYKRSPSSGWDVHYDGGSRLQIIETLISIDPEYGRDIAVKSLINDYISDVRYPENFIRNLNRILNVLFDSVPVVEVWCELEQHIYQLYDFSKAEDFPEISMESVEELSFSELLIKLMTDDYLLPVSEIREEAHGAICDAVFSNTVDHIVKSQLLKLTNADVRSQSSALAVLEAVIAKRKDFVSVFSNEIIQLCRNQNFIVRNIAVNIANVLEIYTGEEDAKQELPPIYKIELPELQMTDWTYPLKVAAEDDFGKHINDPIERVQPFLYYYESIAEYTGIPLQNLIARASRIMDSIELTNKKGMFLESKLRSWLQAADLKLTFYRPKATNALYTLGYVIGELIDADYIDVSDFMDLIIHDSVLSVAKPVARPVGIVLPDIIDRKYLSQKEDWLKKGREDLPLILNCMDNGNIVLGELSRFKNLSWEIPTEYRLSMVCHPNWPEVLDLEDAYNFFPYSSSWYAMEYPHLDSVANKISTVIYSHPLQIEIGKTEWLAFNPYLAFRLGWKLSTEGLFRWINENGDIMIESIYWKDGPINRLPPRMEETCSEGWIVVASKKAIELLSERIGNAIYLKALIRQHNNRNERDVSRNSVMEREIWKHIKNV